MDEKSWLLIGQADVTWNSTVTARNRNLPMKTNMWTFPCQLQLSVPYTRNKCSPPVTSIQHLHDGTKGLVHSGDLNESYDSQICHLIKIQPFINTEPYSWLFIHNTLWKDHILSWKDWFQDIVRPTDAGCWRATSERTGSMNEAPVGQQLLFTMNSSLSLIQPSEITAQSAGSTVKLKHQHQSFKISCSGKKVWQ